FIEKHPVSSCQSCPSKKLHFINTRSRQVVDIPMPKIEVTEYLVYNYQCLCCGTSVSSPIAKELKQEVQYAPKIKSMVNYLNVYQLIPYKRLTELIQVVNGHKISQGSISNFNKGLNDESTPERDVSRYYDFLEWTQHYSIIIQFTA
ncbi:MAG: transposase, partial [Saprospiraceae bacterium]